MFWGTKAQGVGAQAYVQSVHYSSYRTRTGSLNSFSPRNSTSFIQRSQTLLLAIEPRSLQCFFHLQHPGALITVLHLLTLATMPQVESQHICTFNRRNYFILFYVSKGMCQNFPLHICAFNTEYTFQFGFWQNMNFHFSFFLFSLLYIYCASEISNPSGIGVTHCMDGRNEMLLLVRFFYCCDGKYVALIFHMLDTHAEY